MPSRFGAFLFLVMALAGCATITPPPASPPVTTYTIQAGDNLTKISRRFNDPVPEIMNLNPGLDGSKIKIGQQIQVIDHNNQASTDSK
jgi:LysM repeat protein